MSLRVVLSVLETWSLKSAEKHGPNIYENRVSGKSLVSTKVEENEVGEKRIMRNNGCAPCQILVGGSHKGR
jgi:hypothetical protein